MLTVKILRVNFKIGVISKKLQWFLDDRSVKKTKLITNNPYSACTTGISARQFVNRIGATERKRERGLAHFMLKHAMQCFYLSGWRTYVAALQTVKWVKLAELPAENYEFSTEPPGVLPPRSLVRRNCLGIRRPLCKIAYFGFISCNPEI